MLSLHLPVSMAILLNSSKLDAYLTVTRAQGFKRKLRYLYNRAGFGFYTLRFTTAFGVILTLKPQHCCWKLMRFKLKTIQYISH